MVEKVEKRPVEYGVETPFEPSIMKGSAENLYEPPQYKYMIKVYEDVPSSFTLSTGFMYALCEQRYYLPQPNEHKSEFVMLPYLMMFDPTINVWRTLNGSDLFLRIVLEWFLESELADKLTEDDTGWIYFSLRDTEAAKNLN